MEMTTKTPNDGLISRLAELSGKGLSKSDMARVAGVSKQAVTGWFKTGTISKKSAVAIAEAAGVSLAWLLGEEVDEASGLKPKEKKMLELFNQLPEVEQDNVIGFTQLRIKEAEKYVEQYLKGRYKKVDE